MKKLYSLTILLSRWGEVNVLHLVMASHSEDEVRGYANRLANTSYKNYYVHGIKIIEIPKELILSVGYKQSKLKP